MEINKPYLRQEGSDFVLYYPDFVPDSAAQKISHATVVGSPRIVGRFPTEEELQKESMKQFGRRAQRAD